MRRVKFKAVRVDHDGIRRSIYAKGKYCLKYPKNTIVRAREGTLGVGVFKTRKQAEMFLKRYTIFATAVKIIRVRPVGRGNNVDILSHSILSISLDYFYKRINSLYKVNTTNPPPGTIFYPAVEVLE